MELFREMVCMTDLVEVIYHEADVGISHLLALSLCVHLAAARRRVHLHRLQNISPSEMQSEFY